MNSSDKTGLGLICLSGDIFYGLYHGQIAIFTAHHLGLHIFSYCSGSGKNRGRDSIIPKRFGNIYLGI